MSHAPRHAAHRFELPGSPQLVLEAGDLSAHAALEGDVGHEADDLRGRVGAASEHTELFPDPAGASPLLAHAVLEAETLHRREVGEALEHALPVVGVDEVDPLVRGDLERRRRVPRHPLHVSPDEGDAPVPEGPTHEEDHVVPGELVPQDAQGLAELVSDHGRALPRGGTGDGRLWVTDSLDRYGYVNSEFAVVPQENRRGPSLLKRYAGPLPNATVHSVTRRTTARPRKRRRSRSGSRRKLVFTTPRVKYVFRE